MEPRKFHHGDLRSTLLRLAGAVLDRESSETLSMRVLATQAGVSPGAPYRHFRTKEELLEALALSGLEDLRDQYAVIREGNGSPSEKLRAAGRAYLDFARNSPGLYRLIFIDQRLPDPLPEKLSGDRGPFAIFEDLVGQLHRISNHLMRRNAALVGWAALHGLAVLWMEGPLQTVEAADDVETLLLDLLTSIGNWSQVIAGHKSDA